MDALLLAAPVLPQYNPNGKTSAWLTTPSLFVSPGQTVNPVSISVVEVPGVNVMLFPFGSFDCSSEIEKSTFILLVWLLVDINLTRAITPVPFIPVADPVAGFFREMPILTWPVPSSFDG